MNQISITVKNDDDRMFGSETTENIDVDKTLSGYETILRRDLERAFPYAEINLEYGPYAGRSVTIDDNAKCENISDEVAEIVTRVYNDGAFWVYRK